MDTKAKTTLRINLAHILNREVINSPKDRQGIAADAGITTRCLADILTGGVITVDDYVALCTALDIAPTGTLFAAQNPQLNTPYHNSAPQTHSANLCASAPLRESTPEPQHLWISKSDADYEPPVDRYVEIEYARIATLRDNGIGRQLAQHDPKANLWTGPQIMISDSRVTRYRTPTNDQLDELNELLAATLPIDPANPDNEPLATLDAPYPL
jgi:hypothetical protein